ncbi:cysteine peptidase family C39 domain-containing protein [Secundilactobacillus kimchicus]|uniref:cysteine peptidase family C39 domain-containing protein n=1 Tax=Secundilactobacillus kimchicus TaxID=528209 RepID=UPI0024A856CF|nr:cysteine peptidase family C39 domain-containing protein [Secundilactobacillus kimchicus]
MFKRNIYVQQIDESDCGVAALSMILKNYHSNISLSVLRNLAQTNSDGTTALGLVTAAQHFNLDTTPIQADMSIFTEYSEELTAPFIVHVNKNNGLLHYLVILEIHTNYLVIADPDPSIKITKMSLEQFSNIWTGIALFMDPTMEYEPVQQNKDSLWHTARLLLKHPIIIVTIIILTFLSTLITIMGAVFLQQIVDSIVPSHLDSLLFIISTCLLIAYLFHGLFTFFEGYLSSILSIKLSKDLLLDYIQHLFKLPVSFFESRKVGELTSRFNDASNIINTMAKTAVVRCTPKVKVNIACLS